MKRRRRTKSINEQINDSVWLGSPYLSNLLHLWTVTSRFFIHNTSYSCRDAASAWSSRLTCSLSVGYWPALRKIRSLLRNSRPVFLFGDHFTHCLLVVGPAFFIFLFFIFPLKIKINRSFLIFDFILYYLFITFFLWKNTHHTNPPRRLICWDMQGSPDASPIDLDPYIYISPVLHHNLTHSLKYWCQSLLLFTPSHSSLPSFWVPSPDLSIFFTFIIFCCSLPRLSRQQHTLHSSYIGAQPTTTDHHCRFDF